LAKTTAGNQAIKSILKISETGTKGLLVGNFFTNVILSASLSKLWGMINALQIISQLPNFNLKMPANAEEFFIFINDISSFKVISFD